MSSYKGSIIAEVWVNPVVARNFSEAIHMNIFLYID